MEVRNDQDGHTQTDSNTDTQHNRTINPNTTTSSPTSSNRNRESTVLVPSSFSFSPRLSSFLLPTALTAFPLCRCACACLCLCLCSFALCRFHLKRRIEAYSVSSGMGSFDSCTSKTIDCCRSSTVLYSPYNNTPTNLDSYATHPTAQETNNSTH